MPNIDIVPKPKNSRPAKQPIIPMTPQFNETEGRQKRLLNTLGSDTLIIPAEIPRSAISRFLQATDFYYLSGFPEHGAVLVMDAGEVHLFIKENSQKEQVWDGFTMGIDQAGEECPADKVHHIAELEPFLSSRINGRKVHYKEVQEHPSGGLIETLLKQQNSKIVKNSEVFDAITEMRMVKSPHEIEQMRKAIQITSEAHHACMRAGTRHRKEYQFEAEIEYVYKMHGSMHHAFGAIVAAGNHATCQHYIENSGPVGDQDLILVDTGALWNNYCADLTRTFPASGKFTSIQRDLYEIVLASEKAGVEMVAPGVCMIDIHKHSAAILIDGLKGLGLIKGDTQQLVESAAYKEFWPGALCHSLGLDVHDVLLDGYHKGDKPLKPGMVITVEPGFYSQAFNRDIPEEYRQIGIRIEDDVLVTENGCENLSIDTVKEVADVEAMVQSGAVAEKGPAFCSA